jgi:chemotaxis protein MotB
MQYQPHTGDPTLPQPNMPPPFPLPPPISFRTPSRMPWIVAVAMTAAAGYGAYWGFGERAKWKVKAEAAEGKAHEAVAAGEALNRQLSALQAEKDALASDKEALATARDNLAKSVEEKSSELATLKGTTDELREKMKDEIAKGDIQLTESGGKLRVGLVDKILFDSGEASVSKRGEGVLARLGAVLASIEDRQIQVSGHTDNTPISDKLKQQFPTNWELSVARATNVVRFLQENAAVPAERLLASGYGEYQPIANNRTAAGRAKNRRIELLLTPSLAPKRISKAALKHRHASAKESAAAGKASKRHPIPPRLKQ